ncbi:MAG: hypothetical protein ACHQUC_03545 [Chlamydiales bacterium]
MHESFLNELYEGEIQARDNLQFELKSEFFIYSQRNVYKQEFFVFIPESLHVNGDTYSKEQFYSDETSLIRYKTPSLSLKNLVHPQCEDSPLFRLQEMLKEHKMAEQLAEAEDELKLFGDIFKVSLRDRVKNLLEDLKQDKMQETGKFSHQLASLCAETAEVSTLFRQIQATAQENLSEESIRRYFRYIDEFISSQISYFFLILLQALRQSNFKHISEIDKLLCQVILRERHYCKKNHLGAKTPEDHPFSNESILHRRSLLNQFVLEALTLHNFRVSVAEKHAPLLGALAAGIAMLFYMTFFAWKVSSIVITSFPVILFIVFLYILKDRIKEGLKKIYSEQAYRWFPDYSTEIISPKGYKVGKINESFSFISEEQLPEGFQKIRNDDFNEELQALIRQESIIQYKREVTLYSHPGTPGGRRRELSTIFRLNMHHLLQKASNAYQLSLFLDPYSHEIHEQLLPKVYHLNIIIRNTIIQPQLIQKSEINKFRVIVDKNGIKHVEQINHPNDD